MKIVLILLVSLLLFGRGYHVPDNRSQAKNIVKMIDLDYKETRLNGCKYTYDTTSCMDKTIVDTASCEINVSDETMMWIQVVPDTFFGRNMACMNEKVCVNEFSKEKFGSPLCCRRINVKYKQMEADLYNLIPVISSIATIQGSRIFSEVKKPTEVIGEVKINMEAMEPAEAFKGDIARVYLYMDDRYDLQLTSTQRALYLKWHQHDPVDGRECAMAKIIDKIQHSDNRWIKDGCSKRDIL